MEVDAQPSETHRVEGLWFEDGNLVLQAGSSQYRVYRGQLGAQSLVFRDMLQLPQPTDSELVEGCPFVRLPDSEVEATPFFKAMFVPDFFMPFPAPTEFDTVVGCLQLSHKYGVDYLYRRALVHFTSGFPATLHQIDLRREGSPSELDKRSWAQPDEPTFRIRAIQLARQVDAIWVLPFAFYYLSVNFEKLGVTILNGATYNGVHTQLSLQDQGSFFTGHSQQRADTAVSALQFLSYPFDVKGCLDPLRCHSERLGAVEHGRDFVDDFPSSFLHIWATEDWDLLGNVCETCLAVLRQTHKNTRRRLWDELPSTYDLPPWKELEDIKAAAIGTGGRAYAL
ncbi:hypothetical protein DFH06DRAFT_1239749 [Mycena polygramma]|nr:hypothetical protein DFH06DRAFT_1239749 [Mycena polygramma]